MKKKSSLIDDPRELEKAEAVVRHADYDFVVLVSTYGTPPYTNVPEKDLYEISGFLKQQEIITILDTKFALRSAGIGSPATHISVHRADYPRAQELLNEWLKTRPLNK